MTLADRLRVSLALGRLHDERLTRMGRDALHTIEQALQAVIAESPHKETDTSCR